MLALLVVGFNASKVMFLLSPPISERSTEVRLASHKWEQLRQKISSVSKPFVNNIDLDVAFLGTPSDTENLKPKAVVISTAEEKKEIRETIQLPVLTGILSRTDIYGRATTLAILDGQRLKVNDKIRQFRIRKIKDNGVVITRGKKRWFISAPDVPYTRLPASGPGSQGSEVVMND